MSQSSPLPPPKIDRAILSAMSRITCVRCNQRTVYVTPKGVVGKLCEQCFLIALSELPNPYCEYCLGEGEYYSHSEDGIMINCNCSIFDEDGITKRFVGDQNK
jgi:hypothetical protein